MDLHPHTTGLGLVLMQHMPHEQQQHKTIHTKHTFREETSLDSCLCCHHPFAPAIPVGTVPGTRSLMNHRSIMCVCVSVWSGKRRAVGRRASPSARPRRARHAPVILMLAISHAARPRSAPRPGGPEYPRYKLTDWIPSWSRPRSAQASQASRAHNLGLKQPGGPPVPEIQWCITGPRKTPDAAQAPGASRVEML